MRGFVANTDYRWYAFLSARSDIDEVNFWQPGGEREFKTLDHGQPVLFRLKTPYNAIAGVGFFVHFSILPESGLGGVLSEERRRVGERDAGPRGEVSAPLRKERAVGTFIGLGVNLPEDAICPVCFVGVEGRPDSGANRYVLHFEKGKPPPATASWPVALYDKDGYRVPNALNRFAVGNHLGTVAPARPGR